MMKLRYKIVTLNFHYDNFLTILLYWQHEESTTEVKKSEEPQGEVAIASGTLQMNRLCYRFAIRLTYFRIDFRIDSDSGNDLREASESMVGKVEKIPLMVNSIDLERIFIDYRGQCEDIFEWVKSTLIILIINIESK